MKTLRVGMENRRQKPAFETGPGDAYRLDRKLADPTTCTHCNATFHRGRWTWEEAPKGSAKVTCPACRRIADEYPGAWLTLGGEFFEDHRGEVISLAIAKEAHEKAEHPLQRIIAMQEGALETLITTTDPHLARVIAEAILSAFKGKLELDYAKDENSLRASWHR
jgi:NMD protein affecting ribosome stability and mRNA decay